MASEFVVYNLSPGGIESGNNYILTLLEKGGTSLLLQMYIGYYDAQIISIELEKAEAKRPLTHDLIKDLMDQHKIKPTKIEIISCTEGVFYAQIVTNTKKTIDCRPSDAIILSLKYNIPIEIWDSVCEEFCFQKDDLPQDVVDSLKDTMEPQPFAIDAKPMESPEEELKKYQTLLNECLANEDYKKAAYYRDRIKNYKSKF